VIRALRSDPNRRFGRAGGGRKCQRLCRWPMSLCRDLARELIAGGDGVGAVAGCHETLSAWDAIGWGQGSHACRRWDPGRCIA